MFSLEQSRECYKHLINRMVHVFSPQVSGSSELNLSPFLIIWETLERRLIRSTFSSLGLPRPQLPPPLWSLSLDKTFSNSNSLQYRATWKLLEMRFLKRSINRGDPAPWTSCRYHFQSGLHHTLLAIKKAT